jgi:hypothetical protein
MNVEEAKRMDELESALRQIANMPSTGVYGDQPTYSEATKIARATLAAIQVERHERSQAWEKVWARPQSWRGA